MKTTIVRLLTFCFAAFATVVVLTYAQPFFYRKFNSSDKRFLTLLDNVHKKDDNILVFGDSRTVLGVDTKRVKAKLGTPAEIYNVGNFSQDMYQSGYFYGMVGDNTRMVVQCTTTAFFSKDKPVDIPDAKTIPMFLSGYKLNDATRSVMGNTKSFFDNSDFENNLKSRVYFENYITTAIRPLLDNEKYDEGRIMDPYFPHIYVEQRSPNYPVQPIGCDKYKPQSKPVSQLAFLKRARDYFKSKNIKYVMVLMPINPDDCDNAAGYSAEFAKMIRSEVGIDVIDLTTLVKVPDFYDAVHPNHKGAEIVSDAFAAQLKQLVPEKK
ncbi:hypothetical protein AAEO56_13220 [Flavobacterium sp. DGU11]|uniref:SGNH/GDSL hydrolase family protein n=1 Tax=Flavobacterium arundinis TaxID=3139143 RepID=A0ABU9HZ36_9FLAO